MKVSIVYDFPDGLYVLAHIKNNVGALSSSRDPNTLIDCANKLCSGLKWFTDDWGDIIAYDEDQLVMKISLVEEL